VTPLTTAKLILALAAAILLGLGIRSDNPVLRWSGIAFLAAAVIVRFIRPRGENR
jgi:hypothetical protein